MNGSVMTGRRAAGVAILVLILTGVWAVNALRGDRVTGHPVAEWPQPPAVGSCMDLGDADSQVVPCSGLHDAEVTRTFGPLDPMVTSMTQDPVYDACGVAADRYVGARTDEASEGAAGRERPGWQAASPAYRGQPVYASAGERVGRYGWIACVIAPRAGGQYRGSIKGLLTQASPGSGQVSSAVTPVVMPAVFRPCFDRPRRPTSCVGPHERELLAIYTASIAVVGGSDAPSDPAEMAARAAAQQEQWQQQCERLAADIIGTADPTFGGVLLIRAGGGPTVWVSTVPESGQHGQQPDSARARGGTASVLVGLGGTDCTVQAAHGEDLTESLVGWGDRPPPLAS